MFIFNYSEKVSTNEEKTSSTNEEKTKIVVVNNFYPNHPAIWKASPAGEESRNSLVLQHRQGITPPSNGL